MIIGILGGTFDPPHSAHLELTRMVYASKQVDRVLLVPCFKHAFQKYPVSFEHRLEMCQLIASDDFVEVSDIEKSMENPGRTLELVELLQEKYTDDTFRLVVGADIYQEKGKWYRFDLVEKIAPPIYFERKGISATKFGWLPAPRDVSSTVIRQKLKNGESVAGLLPSAVHNYILEHKLYGV